MKCDVPSEMSLPAAILVLLIIPLVTFFFFFFKVFPLATLFLLSRCPLSFLALFPHFLVFQFLKLFRMHSLILVGDDRFASKLDLETCNEFLSLRSPWTSIYRAATWVCYQGEYRGNVSKLKKTLYGLKRSLRAWFGKLSEVVMNFDLHHWQTNHIQYSTHTLMMGTCYLWPMWMIQQLLEITRKASPD